MRQTFAQTAGSKYQGFHYEARTLHSIPGHLVETAATLRCCIESPPCYPQVNCCTAVALAPTGLMPVQRDWEGGMQLHAGRCPLLGLYSGAAAKVPDIFPFNGLFTWPHQVTAFFIFRQDLPALHCIAWVQYRRRPCREQIVVLGGHQMQTFFEGRCNTTNSSPYC